MGRHTGGNGRTHGAVIFAQMVDDPSAHPDLFPTAKAREKKRLRLFTEIHGILLAKGRGTRQTPGEFRRSQNWIGGTRPGNAAFVPPPAEEVPKCMGDLELFLHDHPVSTPVLLKAALAHVQFETIHPFLDGNGRQGRLLITLLLCEPKVLREPMLYLSLYSFPSRGNGAAASLRGAIRLHDAYIFQ